MDLRSKKPRENFPLNHRASSFTCRLQKCTNVIIENTCTKVSVREFLGYLWMSVVVVVIFGNSYLRGL